MKEPQTSSTSLYEEIFPEGVKNGRPQRSGGVAMFPTTGDKNVDGEAKRRAMAVIRYLYENELREVYMREARSLGASFRSDKVLDPETISELASRLQKDAQTRNNRLAE